MDAWKNVDICERIIGYRFTDRRRLLEAINMSGVGVSLKGTAIAVPKNDRLAVHGEKAAEYSLSRRWVIAPLTKGSVPPIRVLLALHFVS